MTHNPQTPKTQMTGPRTIAMHESSFHGSKNTAMTASHGHNHEHALEAQGSASAAAPNSPEHSLPISFPHDEDPLDEELEDALMYFAVADDEGGGHDDDHDHDHDHDGSSSIPPASKNISHHAHAPSGEAAATTASAAAANAADLSVYESGLMRSVHMELQENARIPTFLDNVDRSNSSGVVRKVGSPTMHPVVDIAEVKMSLIGGGGESGKNRMGESSDDTKNEAGADGAAEGGTSGAINLAEKFLRSSHRESKAMNYSFAGELSKLDPTEQGTATSTSGASGAGGAAATDKKGDTTPPFSRGVPVSAEMILETASALAASMGATAAPEERQQQQQQTSRGHHPTCAARLTSHSSHYPYGRAVQLPIPSPPGPRPVPRRGDAEVDRRKALAAEPSTSTTVQGGSASNGGSSSEQSEGKSANISKVAAAPSSVKVSGNDDSTTSKGGTDGAAASKDTDSKAAGGPASGGSAGSAGGDAATSQSASSSGSSLTPPPSANSFTPPPPPPLVSSVHPGNSVIAPAHPLHGGSPVHAQHRHHPPVGSLPYPAHMAMPHHAQTTYLPHQQAHHPHHGPWATTTTVSTDSAGGGGGGGGTGAAGAAAAHHHHHHHHHHVVPVMTNSIKEATRMQNQFGFGGDHVVPSVPLPPPMPHALRPSKTPPVPPMKRVTAATKARSSAEGARKAGGAAADAGGSTTTGAAADESAVPASVSNRVAYERKKEKAKHGRMKLNESIERLWVAMSLAGSRSQKQAETLAGEGGVFEDREGGGVDDDDGAAAGGADVVRTMLECQRIANEAKKFDRPAFIGHAASLVQALNNQCEALVREVKYLKKRSSAGDSPSPSPKTVNSSVLVGTGCQSAVSDADHDCSNGMEVDLSQDGAKGGKKRKIGDGGTKAKPRIVSNFPPCTRSWTECNVDWFSMAVTHGPVVKTITSYLDPSSLMRCQCVAKYWKAIDEFQSDETWMDLCVHRFGRENVRLWENRVSQDSLSTMSTRSRNKMQIYREMCSANVAPHSPMEGNLRLGEAKVDGVSAWASMMARSNGETLRSVKQGSAKGKIPYGTGQAIQGGSMDKGKVEYSSLPVVELRIIVQNTGIDKAVVVPDQAVTVDASTRRRGEELVEVASDERFQRRVVDVDGTTLGGNPRADRNLDEMFRLRLFDAVVLQLHIHARGCPTTAKFQKKANFTKLLVMANGTTFPVVIPFSKRDDVSLSISKFEPEKA